MAESSDNSNESTGLELPSVAMLQGSRLPGGGNIGFGSPVLRAGILRPSLLGPSRLGLSSRGATNVSNNSNGTHTNDANDAIEPEAAGCNDGAGDGPTECVEAVSNPFLKDPMQDEQTGPESAEELCESSTERKDSDELLDPVPMLRNSGIERVNMFASRKTSMPPVEANDFVFGQNVHERAVGETVKSDKPATFNDEKKCVSDLRDNLETANKETEVELKSLNDVARKRKYEEDTTGSDDDNEVNIMDLNCKLFALVNGNWEDRGRGVLRLYDSRIENECSILAFQSADNLRILIISKIWAGMVAARQSAKTLRLTAIDSSEIIKIYLVKARPSEIDEMLGEIIDRIDKRKSSHPDELGAAGGIDGDDNILDNASDIGTESDTNESDTNESDTASVGEPEKALESAIENNMNNLTEI